MDSCSLVWGYLGIEAAACSVVEEGKKCVVRVGLVRRTTGFVCADALVGEVYSPFWLFRCVAGLSRSQIRRPLSNPVGLPLIFISSCVKRRLGLEHPSHLFDGP